MKTHEMIVLGSTDPKHVEAREKARARALEDQKQWICGRKASEVYKIRRASW